MDNQVQVSNTSDRQAGNKRFLVYPGIEVSLLSETALEEDRDRMGSREEETGQWMLNYVISGRLEITRGGRFTALGPGELMASRGRSGRLTIETGFALGGDLALLRISLNPDQARDAL